MHTKHIIHMPKYDFSYQNHEFSFLFGVLFIRIFMRPGSILGSIQVFGISMIFNVCKGVSSTQQGCIYLIKNPENTDIVNYNFNS